MSLQEPTSKMSKSDPNPNGYIAILDDRDTVIRKFKRAVTDSESDVACREGKDGINNLLSIYSAVTGKSIAAAEKEFAGKGYGDFKLAVGETVADCLAPIQQKFRQLEGDKEYVRQVYQNGAEKAARLAERTMRKVYKKVGFTER
jgi:tryptophanyl-tRNA synthetase